MKALVTLTPTEAKRFVAMAVARMPETLTAREKGIMALHPSSSTYFLVEELTGSRPQTDVWMCGAIAPKGLCVEWGSYAQVALHDAPFLSKPGLFPFTWIVKDGKMQPPMGIDELCQILGPDDVYVKGGNAMDPSGNVGVLIGSMAEGTIARVASAHKKRGFKIVFTMGMEKLLPISIKEASRAVGAPGKLDYSMGIRCGLIPVPGITVSEVEAAKIIGGVEAVPISAGGVGGAEGSVVLVIKGEKAGVMKAVEAMEASKGAKLPPVRNPDCKECIATSICPMAGNPKPWS